MHNAALADLLVDALSLCHVVLAEHRRRYAVVGVAELLLHGFPVLDQVASNRTPHMVAAATRLVVALDAAALLVVTSLAANAELVRWHLAVHFVLVVVSKPNFWRPVDTHNVCPP